MWSALISGAALQREAFKVSICASSCEIQIHVGPSPPQTDAGAGPRAPPPPASPKKGWQPSEQIGLYLCPHMAEGLNGPIDSSGRASCSAFMKTKPKSGIIRSEMAKAAGNKELTVKKKMENSHL